MKKTFCTLGLATVLLTGITASGSFAATTDDVGKNPSVTGSQSVNPKVVTPMTGSSTSTMSGNDTRTAAGTVYPGTRQSTPNAPQPTLPPATNSGSPESGGSK
jgi:hypothetical protein